MTHIQKHMGGVYAPPFDSGTVFAGEIIGVGGGEISYCYASGANGNNNNMGTDECLYGQFNGTIENCGIVFSEEDNYAFMDEGYWSSIWDPNVWQSNGGYPELINTFLGTKYLIYYDANGGKISYDKSYYYDLRPAYLLRPRRENYEFLGWKVTHTNGNWGSELYFGGEEGFYGDVWLEAQWKSLTGETYTNSYLYRSSNDPSTTRRQTQQRIYGQSFVTLTLSNLTYPIYESNGWDFQGWNTSYSAYRNSWYDPGETVTSYNTSNSDVTFYAVLTRDVTINYDLNGGTGSVSSTYGEEGWSQSMTRTSYVYATLSSTIPKRSGYTFLGWANSKTATEPDYEAGENIFASTLNILNREYTSSASITLYAVWEADSFKINVNYNVNGEWFYTGLDGFTFGVSVDGISRGSNFNDYGDYVDPGSQVQVFSTNKKQGYNIIRIESTVNSTTNEEIIFTMPYSDAYVNIYVLSQTSTVTLKYGNGEADGKIYLKYDVGWYSDSACTKALNKITPTQDFI